MIKCELGKETHISGHPAQIAVELEELMREVRSALRKLLGEIDGLDFYKEIVKNALMYEEQRNKYAEDEMARLYAENPKLAKEVDERVDALLEMLFGETVKHGRVEEEE